MPVLHVLVVTQWDRLQPGIGLCVRHQFCGVTAGAFPAEASPTMIAVSPFPYGAARRRQWNARPGFRSACVGTLTDIRVPVPAKPPSPAFQAGHAAYTQARRSTRRRTAGGYDAGRTSISSLHALPAASGAALAGCDSAPFPAPSGAPDSTPPSGLRSGCRRAKRLCSHSPRPKDGRVQRLHRP